MRFAEVSYQFYGRKTKKVFDDFCLVFSIRISCFLPFYVVECYFKNNKLTCNKIHFVFSSLFCLFDFWFLWEKTKKKNPMKMIFFSDRIFLFFFLLVTCVCFRVLFIEVASFTKSSCLILLWNLFDLLVKQKVLILEIFKTKPFLVVGNWDLS